MPRFDLRAVILSLFLPMLYWTGAVFAISMLGYPSVVCMTPLAWLLALPLGMRVAHESKSPGDRPLLEAAAGGALLGIWQGVLIGAALAAAPLITARPLLPGGLDITLPAPLAAGLLAGLISMPITAVLALMSTRAKRSNSTFR
jgi:hypothetical protein